MIPKIFISILLLLNLNSDDSLITKEGYGEFLIGKTTLQSVFEKNPEKKQLIYDLGDNNKMVSINFIEEGIELLFTYNITDTPDKILLYQIDITSPCPGKTEKHIGIGSTIEDVLKAYPQKPIDPKAYKKSQIFFYDTFHIYTDKGKVERICVTSN